MTATKALPAELIYSLLSGYKKPEDLIGENGLLKQLTKALVERALDAEMEAHLGHAKNDAVNNPAGNTRNGKSSKTLKGEFGEPLIEIPHDRNGSFEPQLIPKHQTRWNGFDEKILSLYARGMTASASLMKLMICSSLNRFFFITVSLKKRTLLTFKWYGLKGAGHCSVRFSGIFFG